MIKRLALLAIILVVGAYATIHYTTLGQELQSYTSNTWTRTIKRILTLDTLELPDIQTVQDPHDNDLNPVSLNWVKRLLRDFPELSWYANDHVRRTFEGSYSTPNYSWSKAIYGKHYPEFDRAVLSVWCLRAFYNGTREAWRYMISPQNEKEALTWKSFQDIHLELVRFIENHPSLTKDQALLSMETHLLLADCGKTPQGQAKAREWQGHAKAKEWLLFASDTRDFFQKTLNSCPQIYPSLKRLPYPCVELIRRTAYPIHLGHLIHLEGQPRTLRRLIDSHLLQHYPLDFEFYYLVDLCDSAAFLGQLSIEGSLFLTEPMYQANLAVKRACESTLNLDEYDAYMNYLQQRAEQMGLDFHIRQDRVLTRIGAMLRFNEPQYGPMLRRAFNKLNVYLQALIISQFDIRDNDPLKRTPNYIPAVLTNLLQNERLGGSFQDRLDKTFVLGLPFIAQVLQEHRKALNMRRSEPSLPLNFNAVSKRVADNPYILNHVRFHINESNIIQLE